MLSAQHPQVEARRQAELNKVLNGRSPGLEELPQLPYRGCVVSQGGFASLPTCQHAPAWFLFRQPLAQQYRMESLDEARIMQGAPTLGFAHPVRARLCRLRQ